MRLRIKRVGMCTNWKELEAWILKWNDLRSIGNPTA
jgi:hypothetical protein